MPLSPFRKDDPDYLFVLLSAVGVFLIVFLVTESSLTALIASVPGQFFARWIAGSLYNIGLVRFDAWMVRKMQKGTVAPEKPSPPEETTQQRMAKIRQELNALKKQP